MGFMGGMDDMDSMDGMDSMDLMESEGVYLSVKRPCDVIRNQLSQMIQVFRVISVI